MILVVGSSVEIPVGSANPGWVVLEIGILVEIIVAVANSNSVLVVGCNLYAFVVS